MTLALVLLFAPDAAWAEWSAPMRVPEDGRTLVVGRTPQPTRIRVSGTVTSSIDGATLDGATVLEGGVPFVLLPVEARLVRADPLAHRYEYALPAGAQIRAALHVGGLAARHLVTASEATASLQGGIFLDDDVRRPSLPAATEPEGAGDIAIAATLVLPGFFLGGLAFWRRRRRVERSLERRARIAARRVAREAAPLGPAFAEVVRSARALLVPVAALRCAAQDAAQAVARTSFARAPGAASIREGLVARREDSLRRLRALADRLEETATDLASHAVGTVPEGEIDRVVEALRRDLDAAVDAEIEVRAI